MQIILCSWPIKHDHTMRNCRFLANLSWTYTLGQADYSDGKTMTQVVKGTAAPSILSIKQVIDNIIDRSHY